MSNNLPPVHPGRIIAEAIDDLRLSQKDFAAILGITPQYVCDILKGRKGLSTELCFSLPPVIGSTPEMWMRLQQTYDRKVAEGDTALQRRVRAVQSRRTKILQSA